MASYVTLKLVVSRGGATMTTNLAIDDQLLEQARKLGKQKSKLETVSAALEEYVQRRKRLRALEAFATIKFDPKFDYKRARNKR
jgi:hypothetical protein